MADCQIQVIRSAHQQAAGRGKCLRDAEYGLPLFALIKQFSEPRGCSDEFHRNAYESCRTENQQLQRGCGIGGGKCRKAKKENAPEKYAPAAQTVDEVSAKQAEDSARDCRDVEQHADPVVENRASGVGRKEFAQCGLNGQRQDQEFICVECESDTGDGADEPLDGC